MKTLQDYLPFYLLSECLKIDTNTKFLFTGINPEGNAEFGFGAAAFSWQTIENSIRPILRSIQSMTEEEQREYEQIGDFSCPGEMPAGYKKQLLIKHRSEQIKYLLRKKFDIFGLIEEKLAILAS